MSDEAAKPDAERPLRFLLESEHGLLVNVTEERGDHLLIWTGREAAERMVPAFVGGGAYQVSAIEADELREELAGMREQGMRFVLLDPQPDVEGQLLPIEEAIAVYEKLASPPSDADAAGDHFIQRLDRARSRGAPLDPDADQIPVDCPACRGYFTLAEREYRAWRSGRVELVRCTNCQAPVREAEFGRAGCSDCGTESGEMPASMSRAFRRSEHPWRCLDCGEAERNRIAVASAKPRSEVNWYSILVGGAALIALLAGLYVKFVLMAE